MDALPLATYKVSLKSNGNIVDTRDNVTLRVGAATGGGSDLITNASTLTFAADAIQGAGLAGGVFEYQGSAAGGTLTRQVFAVTAEADSGRLRHAILDYIAEVTDAAVKARTKELMDGLPIGETFDWVERVSIPQTLGMLCILFDMPFDEWRDIKRWSDWASGVSAENLTDEYRAQFLVQMGEMLARFDRELEDRRGKPATDDLLSRMVHSEAMGHMEPMERIANIALLIVGGNDTTRNSMSALVEAFDKYPDQLERLRADPSLIPNAAQEIIRWQSPVTHMRRTALEDTQLGGQTIRKGEKVVMWYISANRDEAMFPDAERFDVGRSNARRHLSFGHGIHRCVGAKLAESQIATVIAEMVNRNIRVVPQGAPERLASPFLHGFTAMPVRIEPR